MLVVGGLVDFSSTTVAIVSGACNVLELASPLRAVDRSGASLTAVVEMSLATVAAGSIGIVDAIIFAAEKGKMLSIDAQAR